MNIVMLNKHMQFCKVDLSNGTPPPIPQRSAESHSRWQKIPQKSQGRRDKEDPMGILKN